MIKVTEADANQLYGEIENQGFEYWLVNYASGSAELKKYPELYRIATDTAEAIRKAEDAFEDAGIME